MSMKLNESKLNIVSIPDMFKLCGFTEEMIANMENCKSKPKKAKQIYVIELSNGLVKIGVSSNIKKRFNAIEKGSGSHILHEELFNSDNPIKVEFKMHKHFLEQRTNGEFYNCDFNEAINLAKELCLIGKENLK